MTGPAGQSANIPDISKSKAQSANIPNSSKSDPWCTILTRRGSTLPHVRKSLTGHLCHEMIPCKVDCMAALA
jgi:hypothetical protein